MTKPQACEWVHTQLILIELDARQLVEAFTALTNGAPKPDDRRYGLFRRCCEIVIALAPAATPERFAVVRGCLPGGRDVPADRFRR